MTERYVEDARAGARDARGAAVNVLGIVAQATLPAFHVQLARWLGAAGYGLYTWSAMFVDLFSVVTLFGCDQAVMRQVSLSGRASAASVGSALRIVLVSGLVVFVGIFTAAPSIAAFVGKPGVVGPLRCLAIVPLFYHAATIFLVATQALGVMRWAFWARSIAQPVVLLATTSIALRAGMGPSGAAVAVAIGMAATAFFAAMLYARELPLGETLRAVFTGKLDRETLRVAVPLVLANLLWALVARIDSFFLGKYGDATELGAYAACALYAASISQIRGAFEPVASSLVAPALARHDEKGLSDAIARQTRWLALCAFPLAALLVGFGDPLLAVFGHGFSQGTLALAVLAVGHTVNALALSSFALPLSGNARYTTYVALGALVFQGALCALLVPRWGLFGAACALSAGLVFAQTAQMIIAARVVGVVSITPRLLAVLACAIAALVCGRIAYASLVAPILLRFAMGVGLAAVVYAISAWVFALTRGDRDLARAALRRVRVL
ncbi:MAG TPA: oligosaccharide flippase family protein [Polyangiaceae bacterium]